MGVVWTLLFAVIAAGCSSQASDPPEVVIDRTLCSHCRMLISEVRYAAAFRAEGAEARVFDDIGCLLDAVGQERVEGLRFWFHDMAAGEWIDGDRAVFVSSPRILTPMSGGIVAYGDAATAEQSAVRESGTVIRSLAELLASKKAGS